MNSRVFKKKIKSIIWKLILGFLSTLKINLLIVKIAKKLRSGYKMNLDIAKKIQFQIFFYKSYERHLESFFQKILKEGDIFIDIGAHVGYWTLFFRKLVGETGRGYSFEPNPPNYLSLKRNLKLNSITNVYSYMEGVSNSEGSAKLNICDYNEGGGWISQEGEALKFESIKTCTLDSFSKQIDRKIRLIKIDTEGHEDKVVEGMKKLVSSELRPDYLLVEIDNNTPTKHKRGILDTLSEYTPYHFKGHHLEQVKGTNFESLEIAFVSKDKVPEFEQR